MSSGAPWQPPADSGVLVAWLLRPDAAAGQRRRAERARRRCCCPRTRSPTSSRSCAAPTSTGPRTRPSSTRWSTSTAAASRSTRSRSRPSCSAAASWCASVARRTCTPCSASVPIAANAGYYAEIVREKAILRRLVDAGTRIAQMGYAGEGMVDDVVDRAQQEVYDVTDKRSSEDYAPLSAIMEADPRRDRGDLQPRRRDGRRADRLRRPRRADQRPAPRPDDHRRGAARHGQGAGARHPAADAGRLDDHGRGRRSATACTAPTAGPPRSSPRRDVMLDRPCYEVEFSDGTVIVADGAAPVADRDPRRAQVAAGPRRTSTTARATSGRCASVVTTEEIAGSLRVAGDQRANHAVQNARPLQGADQATSSSRPTCWAPGSATGTPPATGSPARPTRSRCTSSPTAAVRAPRWHAYSIRHPAGRGPRNAHCQVCGAAFRPANVNVTHLRQVLRRAEQGRRRRCCPAPTAARSYSGGLRCAACTP